MSPSCRVSWPSHGLYAFKMSRELGLSLSHLCDITGSRSYVGGVRILIVNLDRDNQAQDKASFQRDSGVTYYRDAMQSGKVILAQRQQHSNPLQIFIHVCVYLSMLPNFNSDDVVTVSKGFLREASKSQGDSRNSCHLQEPNFQLWWPEIKPFNIQVYDGHLDLDPKLRTVGQFYRVFLLFFLAV